MRHPSFRPGIFTLKYLDDDRVEITGLVQWRLWFPEKENVAFGAIPLNSQIVPIIVSEKEWGKLTAAIRNDDLYEYWPCFSRTPPPPRESLRYLFVRFAFGTTEVPWLLHKDDRDRILEVIR